MSTYNLASFRKIVINSSIPSEIDRVCDNPTNWNSIDFRSELTGNYII